MLPFVQEEGEGDMYLPALSTERYVCPKKHRLSRLDAGGHLLFLNIELCGCITFSYYVSNK